MSKTKRSLVILTVAVAAVVLYLLCWPVPITPQAWTPLPAPSLTGQYQENSRLSGVERLSLGEGFAPEDVAIDSEGRIYAGMDDGRIMRVEANGSRHEMFANTGGRP